MRTQLPALDYDIARDEVLADRIIETFNADFLAKSDAPDEHEITPIFILGMPRLGTSLVEQALASHSGVSGLGKLRGFRRIARSIGKTFPDAVTSLSSSGFEKVGVDYIGAIRARRLDSQRQRGPAADL